MVGGDGGQSDLSLKNYGLRLLSKKTKYVCNIQQNSLVANVCFGSIAHVCFCIQQLEDLCTGFHSISYRFILLKFHDNFVVPMSCTFLEETDRGE